MANKNEYIYTKLKDLRIGTKFHVYGIITKILKNNVQLKSGRLHSICELKDETLSGDESFRMSLFLKPDDYLLEFEVGNIMRLHRVKVEENSGLLDGRVFNGTDVVIFTKDDPTQAYTQAEDFSYTSKDRKRVKELIEIINVNTLFNDDSSLLTITDSGRIAFKDDNSEKKPGNNDDGENSSSGEQENEDVDNPESTGIFHKKVVNPANRAAKLLPNPMNAIFRSEKRVHDNSTNVEKDNKPPDGKKICRDSNVPVSKASQPTMATTSSKQVPDAAAPVLKQRIAGKSCETPGSSSSNGATSSDCGTKNSSLQTVSASKHSSEHRTSGKHDIKSATDLVKKANMSPKTKKSLTGNSPSKGPNGAIPGPSSNEGLSPISPLPCPGLSCDESSKKGLTGNSPSKGPNDAIPGPSSNEGLSPISPLPCPGLSCGGLNCQAPGPVILDDDDPRLTNFIENDLVFDGLGDIPGVDEQGNVVFKTSKGISFGDGLEAERSSVEALRKFQWPRYRTKVRIVQMKPNIKRLKENGPKDLLSGTCKRCSSYSFYSRLQWEKKIKSAVKKPLCPVCFKNGFETSVVIEYRIKLILKDIWGTELNVYAVKGNASKFLGCSVKDFQEQKQCRDKVVTLLSQAIASKSSFYITLCRIQTPIKTMYYVCDTELSEALSQD